MPRTKDPNRGTRLLCHLQKYMDAYMYSQMDVANAAGVKRNTVRNWILGHEPGLYSALLVARMFNTSIEKIWEMKKL